VSCLEITIGQIHEIEPTSMYDNLHLVQINWY